MEVTNESTKVITTKICRYWVIDNVLYTNILDGAILDIDEVRKNFEARKPHLDAKRPTPTIIDITKIDKITEEGRGLSSTLTEGISAIAIIISSGLLKIIGNYAIMTNRLKIPAKLFTSLTEAQL